MSTASSNIEEKNRLGINSWFMNPSATLVIGIGNSGRSDDGLGWAFLDALEARGFPGEITYRYQLQIEDAEFIADHPNIIFVDASHEELPHGYQWQKCKPSGNFSFSTHELSPETIVNLCEHVYGLNPNVYVLAIQGFEWELREGLSGRAVRNLSLALQDFEARMEE